jgi:hypothetical protein
MDLTARMELRRKALKILVEKAGGKRPLGSPRRRWVRDVWALILFLVSPISHTVSSRLCARGLNN